MTEREDGEREIFVEEEREKRNKIIIFIFAIVVHTVLYLRQYCSGVAYFLRFGYLIILCFWCLVGQMPNLAFGTPATDTFIRTLCVN